jgi:hypothetical protein
MKLAQVLSAGETISYLILHQLNPSSVEQAKRFSPLSLPHKIMITTFTRPLAGPAIAGSAFG